MKVQKTLIIAEAGVNHNGDLESAKKLVDIAADSGADIVKFQTFFAEHLVTASAKKAKYQVQIQNSNESQYEMLRRLELTPEMHKELIAHCNLSGIEFLSTAFDIKSFEFLEGLGMKRIKIPSGEITNLPYLRHVGRLGKPTILSTGMSTLGEIVSAVEVLEEAGTPRTNITILHCTSEYPTAMRDVNLNAMTGMQSVTGLSIGYSDHTMGIEVAIAAVALGANVIEKHFTLDRNLPGPDHKASLEPDELRAMTKAIRNIEVAFGSSEKTPTAGELENREVVRKSLVALRDIATGELFSEENIGCKRPGTGISPMLWDDVIGQLAQRDFDKDGMIEL